MGGRSVQVCVTELKISTELVEPLPPRATMKEPSFVVDDAVDEEDDDDEEEDDEEDDEDVGSVVVKLSGAAAET
jgi:hypothetical protein